MSPHSHSKPSRSQEHPNRPDPSASALAVHDLNQLLSVISGRVGLLQAMDLSAEARRHLAAIALACGDAADLSARLEDGGVTNPPSGCDAEEVSSQALEMALGGPDCQVEGQSPAGESFPVAVPAQVLREVLVNLLINAREAMPGGGRVMISATKEGDRVRLRVADNGPGIDPALAGNIFTQGVSGTGKPDRGLGLAGCRALVAQFGGTLALEDSGPPGAVFMLDLPAAAGEMVPGKEARLRLSSRADEDRIPVLVVDDEEAVRAMLVDVLMALGCAVTTAGDAAEARRLFRSGAFAVALLDQTLPGEQGTDLAGSLRENDPCLVAVLMSGWGGALPRPGALPGGVDFTIRKPLEIPGLQRMLMEAMRLHAERTALTGSSPGEV